MPRPAPEFPTRPATGNGVPGHFSRRLPQIGPTCPKSVGISTLLRQRLLEAGCPADVGDGYTVVGGYEREDGVSRPLILRGERHDIDPGDTVTVSGVLRVVEHAACTVNGAEVPGWTEIRVEQFRPGPAC